MDKALEYKVDDQQQILSRNVPDDKAVMASPPLHTQKITVTVETAHEQQRLDKFLALSLPHLSRSRLQTLITQGYVSGPTGPILSSTVKVCEGHTYTLQIPPPEPASEAPCAEKISLHIVFEDTDIIVIDKPPGLVVHPAPGNWTGTLVNALLAHCGSTLSGISGMKRPGIVHRLDKETSGLIVVAKNDQAHHGLSQQFSTRSLSRLYWAFVWGTATPLGNLTHSIGRHPVNRKKMSVLRSGGRSAQTTYKKLETYGSHASLVECALGTGRTHQIRVHLAHIHHSVIGDSLYGCIPATARSPTKAFLQSPIWGPKRHALHAHQLKLVHPCSQKAMIFTSPLPPDMQALQQTLQTY